MASIDKGSPRATPVATLNRAGVGVINQRIDRKVVASGCRPSDDVSLHEAGYTFTAVCPWGGVFLVYSDGICCRHKHLARGVVVALFGKLTVDGGL